MHLSERNRRGELEINTKSEDAVESTEPGMESLGKTENKPVDELENESTEEFEINSTDESENESAETIEDYETIDDVEEVEDSEDEPIEDIEESEDESAEDFEEPKEDLVEEELQEDSSENLTKDEPEGRAQNRRVEIYITAAPEMIQNAQ